MTKNALGATGRQMKILLILPDTKGSTDVWRPSALTRMVRFLCSGTIVSGSSLLPPLGLLTIAASTPAEVDVAIVDEKVGDRIDLDADVDLVGISILAHSARRGYEIADQFRRNGRKVVLGGFHASLMWEEALGHADAVVVGEAEPVWKCVVEDARAGTLRRIYRSEGFQSLQHSPPPRIDLIGMHRYMVKNVIQVTRGCPFGCDFCSVSAYFGQTFRVKPVEQVLRELRSVREGDFVVFVDDNIVGKPGYAKDLFKALVPLRITWVSQGSLSIANDGDLLKLAAESGCWNLLVGIETVEAANTESVGRKIEPARLEEQIRRIHEAGIGIAGSFMFGLDNDTPETFEKTSSFCTRNHIEVPSFNALNPTPGTSLFRRMNGEGRLRNNGYREYEDILFRRKLFYCPARMSEREFYEGFDRMCRKVFSYADILRRNLKHRIHFKEHLYANLLFRECDFQLGRRSMANLSHESYGPVPHCAGNLVDSELR